MAVKTQVYPADGVLALLTRYIEAYRLDVAQALRANKDSADYDRLVRGARGQHFDPFIWAIAGATGQTPGKVYEALIMTAWAAAEQSHTTRRNHRPAKLSRPKTLNTLKGSH